MPAPRASVIVTHLNLFTDHMMKRLLSILALTALTAGAFAGSKLDYFAQQLVDGYADTASRSSATAPAMLIVRLADGYSFDDLDVPGVKLRCDLGDGTYILSADVPSITDLAASEKVERIEYGPKLQPCLRSARAISGVDAVHSGSDGLPGGFDGTGVLVGIYDEGFDPGHPMLNNAEGQSRLKVYLQHYLYQRVFTPEPKDEADIPDGYSWYPLTDSRFGTDWKYSTHGTQCLGILTGSKVRRTDSNGSKYGGEYYVEEGDNPFYGVATNADIYVTCGGDTSADILACFKRVVDYAERHGQPVVLSLSQATYAGPHDGSTLFCQEMAKLGEKALICIGSGNVGDTKMAIEKQFTATDNILKTSMEYYSGVLTTTVQFWADDDTMLSAEFGVYDKSTAEMLFSEPLGSKSSATLQSKITFGFDDAFSAGTIQMSRGVDESNNRAYVHFTFKNIRAKDADNLVPVMIVGGTSGQTINGYIGTEGYEFVTNGIDGCAEGRAEGAYNDLASGENIISVGAYVSKNSWVTLNNKESYIGNPVGSILSYSSYGPASATRTVPTLCAPGMKISCPLSSYYTATAGNFSSTGSNVNGYLTENGREYFWQTSQGTSLATPFVAGTVALWLQANPQLNHDDVMTIIRQTSVKDSHVTSSATPMQWGEGKLDALAGTKMALKMATSGLDETTVDGNRHFMVTETGNRRYDIFYTGNSASCSISLHSISGALIKSVDFAGSDYNLDASALAAGLYILTLTDSSVRETEKIILK